MDRLSVADSRPLPPGCRFHPSDEQLLRYYLLKKNTNYDEDNEQNEIGFELIKEVDIQKYNPFNLPEAWSYCYGYKGRKRHWYGYCVRVMKDERIVRTSVEGGFWKRRGRVREVTVGGGVVLGSRVSFVFYLGDCVNDAVKTNWCMHEYNLVDADPKPFVLCRVFVKFCQGFDSNSKASETALCEGKNVSAVRHIGVQHDETVKSDIEGPKECDIKSVDRGIISSGNVKEEDDDDTNNPGIVPARQRHFHPIGSSMTGHEKSSEGLTIQDYIMSSDDLTEQELNCILEEDYLELNDLLLHSLEMKIHERGGQSNKE